MSGLAWFTTSRGRLFTRFGVGLTGFSIFGFHLAAHGPMQKSLKEVYQVYSDGKEKLISKSVQQLVKNVIKDSNLKEKDARKIKFFNVIGHELFHSGDIRLPWGAMVGIPFPFEDINDINFSELRLGTREPIDWIVDGHDLLKALTLSEDAKKFGILREIYSCDIWTAVDNATISTGSFFLAAESARRFNARRNAFERLTLKNRLLLYAVCYALAFVLYRCLRDPLKHITDKHCDKKVAATGREYLEGGIEYYEKSLLRNKALRKLLGKSGERRFDKDGNYNYFLLAPKLPLKKRLHMLQDLKKELQTVTL